jgi:hypothetical protein
VRRRLEVGGEERWKRWKEWKSGRVEEVGGEGEGLWIMDYECGLWIMDYGSYYECASDRMMIPPPTCEI